MSPNASDLGNFITAKAYVYELEYLNRYAPHSKKSGKSRQEASQELFAKVVEHLEKVKSKAVSGWTHEILEYCDEYKYLNHI